MKQDLIGWKIIDEEPQQQDLIGWKIIGPEKEVELQSGQARSQNLQNTLQEMFRGISKHGEAGITGFNRPFQKVAHGLLQPALESGYLGQGIKRSSENLARAREQEYQNQIRQFPLSTLGGNIGGNLALNLPAITGGGMLASRFLPGTSSFSTILKNLLGGGIGGAAGGLSEYQQPGESRLGKALAGGAAGALLGGASPLFTGGTTRELIDFAKKQMGNKALVAKDVLEGLSDKELKEIAKRQSQAQKLGIQLTPAEASGNPILAEFEGTIGRTPESKKTLVHFKGGQKEKQKEAIDRFLETISPEKGLPEKKITNVAEKLIEGKKEALRKEAEPFYEAAKNEKISRNKFNSLLKDSNIMHSYSNVLKNPVYASDLEKIPKNSIGVLDLVKRNLYDREKALLSKGKSDQASRVAEARRNLTSSLDDISDTYKTARGIYTEEMPLIKELEESTIGKISKMKGKDLDKVSNEIFNKNMALERFEDLRNKISAEDPEAWRLLVKNEIENKMKQSKNLGKTKNYGSEFQNIIADENTYNKLYSALKLPGVPGKSPAQKQLEALKNVTQHLINKRTVKTAAGQAETKVSKPRSTGEYAERLARMLTGGKYDKAAVEILTDPNWQKYLPKGTSVSEVPKGKELVDILEILARKKND